MSYSAEAASFPTLSPASYQAEVIQYRRSDTQQDAGWEKRYAPLVMSEHVEFLVQHGNVALALLPRHFVEQIAPPNRDTLLHAADEAGDLLWLLADASNRSESSLNLDVQSALLAQDLAPSGAIDSFQSIEAVIANHADHFAVPNKLGGKTALASNPFYVFQRCFNRLVATLNSTSTSFDPQTMTDLEPCIPLSQAIGECTLVLGYTLPKCLGVSLEQTALFNLAKLKHRQEFTKQYDLTLPQFLGALGIVEPGTQSFQPQLF